MSHLLDANILSELARPKPDHSLVLWMSERDAVDLSAFTLQEMLFALTRKPCARLERFMERFIATFCRVHPVTVPIAKRAGIMRGQFARRGLSRSQSDMLIAATASAHGLTLVTRNERDFDGCGVATVNPFSQ